ncbi:hypothetical protein MG293_020098 [Ovis ammon polii]|uniref:Uncharacterized protein n=1 Tax=Ovis ammon polii TaxID=230172 RepID=A0AAD4TPD9_OVIAM|nr:hypothetical protein MG293_020098 [Ovis ammon polii]
MNVPLICDYGSGFSKVGFAGTEAPLAVFPTTLGKLRHEKLLVGMEEEDWFIGNEVPKNRGKLNLLYPISRAAITNWDDMEKVLHVAPEQHPLLMAEPPLNSTSSKERLSQILFETFSVPALYLANQGVLSLYASGHTAADRECARDLKEKNCFVALDFEKEKAEANSPSYLQKCQLPDGQEIDLGRERFFCPEALFQPNLIAPEPNSTAVNRVRRIQALWPGSHDNRIEAGSPREEESRPGERSSEQKHAPPCPCGAQSSSAERGSETSVMCVKD